jgi:hypothetical protein
MQTNKALAIAQAWKALWTANAYSSTTEYSAGVLLIAAPDRRRNAWGAEVKVSIANTNTDDTRIDVFSAPGGVLAARGLIAKDSFVLATSGATDPYLESFMVEAELVGSGFVLAVTALGATENMAITASYLLLR